HAHQLRHPVYFRRTRTAFSCLAVPPAGKIRRLRALDVMNRIEHDHAFGYFRGVIAKSAAFGIAAPVFERGGTHGAKINVSGERTPLACWRTSPGVRELFSAANTF